MAGYRDWLGLAGHLSVLTGRSDAGTALARMVASSATRHALEHGLLPQWRARRSPPAESPRHSVSQKWASDCQGAR